MKKSFLALLILLFPLLMFSQGVGGYGSPYIKNYSTKEYKADPQCLAAIQDHKGIMYVANTMGVLVYDSHNWNLISNRNHSKILSLAVDKHGMVLVGGINEFGFLKPNESGQLKYYSLSEQLKDAEAKFGEVIEIAVENDRTLFVTKSFIFELKDSSVKKLTSKKIENAFYVHKQLYVYDEAGQVYILVDNLLKPLFSVSQIRQGIKNIMIIPFQNRNLLLTDKAGFYTFDPNLQEKAFSLQNFTTEIDQWIPTCKMNDAIELTDGKFAIASTLGIVTLNSKGKVESFVNKNKGLLINDILSLFLDKSANLWAMSHNGFSKIETESTLTKFDASNGLDGVICATTVYHGVRYVGAQEGIYYLPERTNPMDGQGEMFKGVKNGNHPSWNFFEANNQLLVATTQGVMMIQGTEAIPLFELHKVYNFATSKKFPNEIFLAAYDGLMSIHCNKASGKAGFSLNKIFKDLKYPIWSIATDANGDLWLSTLYEGVFYVHFKDSSLDNYEVIKFGKQAFRRYDHCFTSIEGNVVTVCTQSGMYKAVLPNKNAFSVNDIQFIADEEYKQAFPKQQFPITQLIQENSSTRWINLSTECGRLLKTADGKTSWKPIIFKDKPQYIHQIFHDGRLLWICTDNGLFRYDPQVRITASPVFNALITRVTLNNDSVCFWGQSMQPMNSSSSAPIVSPKEISYSYNSVLFDFAATSFIKESENEFRYKLEGFDKEWSPWTSKMSKEYTNLHERSYCFKVQARNIMGVESTVAEYSFEIKAPWYRTILAYLAYIIAGGLVFFIGLRVYTKSLKDINLKLERTVEERTQEIKKQAEQLEKLSIVASETDNAVVLIDREFRIEWVNEGFTRLYGFTMDEYVKRYGRSLIEFSVNPQIMETISRCRETKKSVVYQTESPTKSNRRVWTQTTLTPILDADGEIEKFVVLETDIHLLKEAEKAITEQAIELAEANVILEETQQELMQQREELLQVNDTLVDSNKKISHQNELINSSIRYAKNIQEAILPLSERLNKYVDWAVIYQPKDIVSGDFYWFARISGHEQFILATIDCTGHGVPGAFMSMVAERLLNEIVKLNGVHDPAVILDQLDAGIKKALKQDRNQNNDGMDISLCLFNREDNGQTKVVYAGAKTKIYYHRKGELSISAIKGDSRHIGGQLVTRNHGAFHNHELLLNEGDTIVMLTDGLIDQNDVARKRFGTQKFVKLLESNVKQSIDDLRDCVQAALDEHMDGTSQRDDITVFFVRI